MTNPLDYAKMRQPVDRPDCPTVYCHVCTKAKGQFTTPEKYESTGIHIGSLGHRGAVLIRVNCHGEQQDIAASFDWLRANNDAPILAFDPNQTDLGMIALQSVVALPPQLKSLPQLSDGLPSKSAPKTEPTAPPQTLPPPHSHALHPPEEDWNDGWI